MKCVVCGKEIAHGHICGKCLAEREKIAKVDSFEIIICPRCGFIRTEGTWKMINLEDAIRESIISSLYVFENFNVKEVLIDLQSKLLILKGQLYGDDIDLQVPFTYKIKRITCQRCSREAGGYYEAILQLRAENRKLRIQEVQVAKRVIKEVLEKEIENEKAFLTKVEERKEGIDFYFGSRDIGRKVSKIVAKELGGKITESKKLSGRTDGRDMYRFTYLVRLPSYENGDVVLKDGKFCVVKNQKIAKGVDIHTGKDVNVSNSKLIAKSCDLEEGVIINVDESVAEIICNDGRVILTEKPYGASLGDDVLVFEYNDKYYSFTKKIL